MRYIPRNTNKTPVQRRQCRSTRPDSASLFDDNLIDGHGLSASFIFSLHLLHFHFSQSFLSKCSRVTKKRTTVQVVPAAIVCTGYDTVSHFVSPINKMASFQVMLVHCIPPLASSRRKMVVSFWSALTQHECIYSSHFSWQGDACLLW